MGSCGVFEERWRWGKLGGQSPSDPAAAVRAVLASLHESDAGRIPARLCALCAELLSVDGASISLMAHSATRRILCSTDQVALALAEAQYTLGVGPCLEAFTTGAPVLAADLREGTHAQRWPVFAGRALELGAGAVFSFPLVIGAIAAGTLDLYRAGPAPLTESEVSTALLIADSATLGVLRLYGERAQAEYVEGDGDLDWLGAEVDHDEVHQATGMVMVQRGVEADEALLILRARAFARGITVSELAREVVQRRTAFEHSDEP